MNELTSYEPDEHRLRRGQSFAARTGFQDDVTAPLVEEIVHSGSGVRSGYA